MHLKTYATTGGVLVVLTAVLAAMAAGGCPADLASLVSGLSFGAGSVTTDNPVDSAGSSDANGSTDNSDTTSTGGTVNPVSEPDATGTDQTGGSDSPAGGTLDSGPSDNSTTTIKTAFTIDPAGLSGKFLMAFLGCDGDSSECSNPVNHRVYIASSDDGATWTVPPDWQPYQGSVPDLVERGEKIYIYTPNEVVIIDETTGEVSEPVPVEVETDLLPAGFVDPSPTLDENGRIVLFFIAGSFEAIGTCTGGVTTCTVPVYSATETDALDGIHFKLDDGVRAEVPVDTTSEFMTATDPDIFYDGTQWVLYVSYGASMSLWTSSTLRGTYTRSTTVTDGLITHGAGGVGSGIFDESSGQYWTFAHAADDSGLTVIRRAVHSTLTTQLSTADFATVLRGTDASLSESGGRVASPGVWKR